MNEPETARALRAAHSLPAPNPALEARVAQAARQCEARLRRQSSPRRRRTVAILAAALGVAGIAASLVVPPLAQAARLRETGRLLHDSPTIHTRLRYFRAGSRGQVRTADIEVWTDGRRWRQDGRIPTHPFNNSRVVDEIMSQVCVDGRAATIQPRLKTVLIEPAKNTFWQRLAADSAAQARKMGESLLADPRWLRQDRTREVYGGHRLDWFVRDGAPGPDSIGLLGSGPFRSTAVVDLDRRMLMSIAVEGQTNDRWEKRLQVTYNTDPLPDTIFSTAHLGYRVIDAGQFGREQGARLRRPLTRLRAGRRTIAVRDVSVTPLGDVQILYTDGETPNKPYAEETDPDLPTDSLGTVYLGTAGAYDGFARYSEGGGRGLIVDGEVVHGVCFTPRDFPTSAWKPRTVYLKWHFNEPVGKGYRTRTVGCAIPLRAAGGMGGPLREALDILSLPGGNLREFRAECERTRCVDRESTGDWADLLAVSTRYEQSAPDDVWAKLYKTRALRGLGRTREALEQLKRAQNADILGVYETECDTERRAIAAAARRDMDRAAERR